MKKQFVAIAAVICLLVAGGVVYIFASQDGPTKSDETDTSILDTSENKNDTADDTEADPGATTVVFTDDGFDKTTYTVKAGETVTIKNESSQLFQFSSDDHPTHQDNHEINATEIAPGESTTVTPETKGEFGIHDHIRSQFMATLIVE